ncbi:hypothetical protein HXX76_001181 [Chlamydomonas incerta]|uniref:Uncharacterized protein n=1 Tax=Chlamydomonas incerta TaxID=51695 RepID=A0A836B1A6_CHLIN|nr:hypothetical protein HXX76_001181 [Chlamydomonas incerta]|eukprot:KAG2444428.1 hypothetical protein HXX76_001181 [Chlamydomonas incerta]
MPIPASASSTLSHHQCANDHHCYCYQQPHAFAHHPPAHQPHHQAAARLPPCPLGDRRRRSCHTGADLCHDSHGHATAANPASPPPAGATRRHSFQGLDVAPPGLGCSPFLAPLGSRGSGGLSATGSGGRSHAGSEPLSAGLMRIASSFTNSVTEYLTDLVAWTTAEHPPMSPIVTRTHAAGAGAAAAAGGFGADAPPPAAAAAAGCGGGSCREGGGSGGVAKASGAVEHQRLHQRHSQARGYAPVGAAACPPYHHSGQPMLLPVPVAAAEAAAEAVDTQSADFVGGGSASSGGGVGFETGGAGRVFEGISDSGGATSASASGSPRSGSGPVPRSRPGAASAGGWPVGGTVAGMVVGSGAAGGPCSKKDA